MAQDLKVLHLTFGAENAGKTKAPTHECEGLLKAWQVHLRLSFFTHSGILSHHDHLTLNRSMSLHYPLVVNPLRCCLRELVHVSVLSTSTQREASRLGMQGYPWLTDDAFTTYGSTVFSIIFTTRHSLGSTE